MRCSVSPWLRASAACMLMQLAQPLICEERIFTSSTRLGSRLAAIASAAPVQAFMTSGAAVRTLTLAVIGPSLSWVCDDMTSQGPPNVTSPRKNFAPPGFIPARQGGRGSGLKPGLDGLEQPETHGAVVAPERDHEAHSPMTGGAGIARQGADAGKGSRLEEGAVAAAEQGRMGLEEIQHLGEAAGREAVVAADARAFLAMDGIGTVVLPRRLFP